jgi:hypothetical protein
MAKTRDLAKARLDELRRYLENPENVLGKTGPELADEILRRYLSFRKFRKPGRPYKWLGKEFRRLLDDILAVCPEAFNSAGEGKYMLRNARSFPPAEKIAHRLKIKFPSNPKYQIAPTTLAKQIQEAVMICGDPLSDWQRLVR